MKQLLAILGVAVMTLSLPAALTPVLAQTETAPPKTEHSARVKQIQGQIERVDPSGKMVTLSNGTTLEIPDSVKVNREALKPGAQVQASYEEEAGGQKVATALEVHPPKR
jgi:NADH dehydrogenase FAD-containing subunit